MGCGSGEHRYELIEKPQSAKTKRQFKESNIMELYIGGCHQGKYNYVLTKEGTDESRIWKDFHRWFRERLEEGGAPEEEANAYFAEHPDCVVISDEVGNGIVPMDAFEREYRERLGRMLVEIASKSERVERVICGIGQRIK